MSERQDLLDIIEALECLIEAVKCSEQRFSDRPGYLESARDAVKAIRERVKR